MNRLVLISALCLLACLLLNAATTGNLLPAADGSQDSASFTNGSVACNTVDCSAKVKETSGATCASPVDSDGATSYITSATLNAKQTFTLDISSIPNGNTITAVQVYTCAARGATGDSAKLITVVGGTETDCATTFTPGSSYGSFNCVITLSSPVNKGAGTAAEIGVLMMAAKTINFSKFAAIITHAPPGGRRSQTIVAVKNREGSDLKPTHI